MNFCNKIVATKAAKETPIIQMAGVSFIHTTHNDITFFGCTKGNINAALCLHFLHGFIKVARSYFEGELNESAVRQNFSLLYELLDEVMDYGYPQLLDANLLKEYIRTGKQKKQPNVRAPFPPPTGDQLMALRRATDAVKAAEAALAAADAGSPRDAAARELDEARTALADLRKECELD